jgi:putative ABC transport system permease protein
MRPRWRKVLHDLKDSKLRTLLVVASIAVGAFAVGVIAGTYAIISHDMSASYAENNPANVELRTSDFERGLVDSISAMRGIEEAEGRRVFTLRARTAGDEDWISLSLVAVDDFDELNINLLRPEAGQIRPEKNEVTLESTAAEDLHAAPGDVLEVELLDGTVKHLPIVGVVQDQTTGAGDFLAPPFAFITGSTLSYLHQPDLFNRIYATVTTGEDDATHLRAMATEIKEKMEGEGLTVARTRISLSSEHPMTSIVQAVLGILLALGVLILLLSGSLIANTLNALLSQHLRPIGVIKLVGGRRQQIVQMYFTLLTLYCAFALLIAVPLGAQGAYALAAFVADKLNFSLFGYRIVPLALLIQVIVGLALPLLIGLRPVYAGASIPVQRALTGNRTGYTPRRADAIDRSEAAAKRRKWFSDFAARKGLRLSRPLLISLRNTFRRKGRLSLTLFTLTMGGAIFVAVFNVRVSLHDYIGQIGEYFLADVTVDFDRAYPLDEIRGVARQVPGVVDAEAWAYASADILYPDDSTATSVSILAPPSDSRLVSPMLLSGRWLQPGDRKAITLSEGILDDLPDLTPGDTVRLRIDGEIDEWPVVGIFQFTSQQGTIAYSTYEYVSELTHMPNRSASFRIVSDDHHPKAQQTLADQLEQHFLDLGYHVHDTRTGESTLQTASEWLDVLVVFLMIMALLTASVGSMGLTGAMAMNVLERTREIGIMRSIGAADSEIMRTVIIEGVLIGVIAWVLGGLLSVPFTYMLATILSYAIFQSLIPVHFTIAGFALWLLTVLVLSIVASVLPARNAARLTIREVLAYE